MQPISRPLTPVAQAVTDRLYNNDDKICKGGPVKSLVLKLLGEKEQKEKIAQ